MAVTCSNCGTSNRDGARFCSNCATALGGFTARLQPIGTVLNGHYRLLEVLGSGGMGAVYLAEHTSLGGRVAIKEMLDGFADAAERAQAEQQFKFEARMLFNLRHPNLPRMSEYFDENSRSYLVMDYIEGRTFQQLLDKSSAPAPEAQVLAWAVQLCDVLGYLHRQTPPVIFRDLKPSNIMLEPSGTIKLIDFGIARIFNPGKNTDTLKMGTIGYAPPEQYGGKGQTTPQSDIYALGATLHQMLTHRDPSTQPFVFPSARSINPAVSPNTDAVLAKAVQYDPANRFQSAAEMNQALQGKSFAPPSQTGLPTQPTVICPQCNAANSATEIYCQRCAHQLVPNRACPHCGKAVPQHARFCTNCGRTI